MEKIKLQTQDWRFDAGLVGLTRVLKHAGHEKDLEIIPEYIEFNKNLLQNYGEKLKNCYFDLFFDKSKFGFFLKIVQKQSLLWEHEGIDEMSISQLQASQKMIKSLKEFLDKNSVKRYLIHFKEAGNIIDEIKKTFLLPSNKTDKEQEIEKNVEHVRESASLLIRFIKTIFDNQNRQKLINWMVPIMLTETTLKGDPNKGMYPIGNSVKTPTFIEAVYGIGDEIKEIPFVENYFMEKKTKYCSVLNEMTYEAHKTNYIGGVTDEQKKTSKFWHFQNNEHIGDLAMIVYISQICGFHGRTLRNMSFIRANINIVELIEINDYMLEVLNLEETENKYFDDLLYLSSNHIKSSEIIRVGENGASKEQVFGKTIRFIVENKEQIQFFASRKLPENIKAQETFYQMLLDVMSGRIGMYHTLQIMIGALLSSPDKCKYNINHVSMFADISNKWIKTTKRKDENMEHKEGLSDLAKKKGYALSMKYKSLGINKKRETAIIRLLAALRSKNPSLFMDILIKLHLNAGTAPSPEFAKIYQSKDLFNEIGHSFLIGFMGAGKSEKKEEGEN